MVKGMIKQIPHADYEALYRTFPLSEKPGYGKGLLDGVNLKSEDLHYKGSFESERFIHGKVHSYLAKFASNMDALKLAEYQSKIAALSRRVEDRSSHGHDTSDEIVNHVKLALHVSDRALKASDLKGLPKGLRIFVLAHLLHDAGIDARQSIHKIETAQRSHVDRDVLKSRMALKRLLQSLGAEIVMEKADSSSKVKVSVNSSELREDGRTSERSIVSSDNDVSSRSKISSDVSLEYVNEATYSLNNKVSASRQSALQCAALPVVGLLIASGNLRLSKVSMDSNFKHSRIVASTATVSLRSAESAVRRTVSGDQSVTKRRTEGFGTAPIWYQQSMENGPPAKAFSLKRKM